MRPPRCRTRGRPRRAPACARCRSRRRGRCTRYSASNMPAVVSTRLAAASIAMISARTTRHAGLDHIRVRMEDVLSHGPAEHDVQLRRSRRRIRPSCRSARSRARRRTLRTGGWSPRVHRTPLPSTTTRCGMRGHLPRSPCAHSSPPRRSGRAMAVPGSDLPGRTQDRPARLVPVRTLLNIIWLVFAGFWLFVGYMLTGIAAVHPDPHHPVGHRVVPDRLVLAVAVRPPDRRRSRPRASGRSSATWCG